jgi:predicted transcriptional regulator
MAKGKTRKELESAREIAFMLYMSSVSGKEIADRVGVSAQSLTKWVADGLWKEKRAAKTITRVELMNKILNQISDLLDTKDETSGTADKLSKLMAVVERLDKKNSPIQYMEVFIDFVTWIQNQSITDKLVTADFIKTINRYQDAYITTLMSAK